MRNLPGDPRESRVSSMPFSAVDERRCGVVPEVPDYVTSESASATSSFVSLDEQLDVT
jgi:hypothetical protein